MITRRTHHGRQAFTLIELLVVIAIIAILAAILFPVFAQAREKARAISCLSNLKQLDLGFQMYAQDYDETFPYWEWSCNRDAGPVAGCPDGAAGQAKYSGVWFNAIYPYVKNGGVYACPDDRLKATPSATGMGGWSQKGDANMQRYGIDPALWHVIMSYGVNEPLQFGELGGPVTNPYPGTSGTSMAQLDKVASTMLVADAWYPTTGSAYNGSAYKNYSQWTRTPDPNDPNDPAHYCLIHKVAYPEGYLNNPTLDFYYPDPCSQAPPAWDSYSRHTAGDNIALADGHAKYYKNSRITNDLYAGTYVNGG